MKASLCLLLVSFSVACGSSDDEHAFDHGLPTSPGSDDDDDGGLGGLGGNGGSGSGGESGDSDSDSGDGDGDSGGGDSDGGAEACDGQGCDCPPGFTEKNGVCQDVDECGLAISACHPSADCQNEEGGYTCLCPVGTFGDGRFCLLSDVCESAACGAGSCHYIPAGSSCECPLGSRGDSCETSCQGVMPSDPLLRSWVEYTLGDFAGNWAELDALMNSLSARQWANEEGGDELVASLEGLECWAPLERLELSHQSISGFGPLAGLTQLQSLDLSCNPGNDLAPLANLYQLQELYLDNSNCPGSVEQELDLSPLSTLLQLSELAIGNKRVLDWSLISSLKGLRRIHGRAVNAVDLLGSDIPASVTAVSLPESGLGKLPDLAHLKGIVQLNFSGNSLVEVNKLLTFSYSVGAEIRLKNNPISCAELQPIEQELALRGAKVFSDCLPD